MRTCRRCYTEVQYTCSHCGNTTHFNDWNGSSDREDLQFYSELVHVYGFTAHYNFSDITHHRVLPKHKPEFTVWYSRGNYHLVYNGEWALSRWEDRQAVPIVSDPLILNLITTKQWQELITPLSLKPTDEETY